MQKASPSWQEAKDWQWQEACRRETVIRPLAEQGRVSRQEAAAAARAAARQGARCGGVLLSVRANDVRRLQQHWISRKTPGRKP